MKVITTVNVPALANPGVHMPLVPRNARILGLFGATGVVVTFEQGVPQDEQRTIIVAANGTTFTAPEHHFRYIGTTALGLHVIERPLD